MLGLRGRTGALASDREGFVLVNRVVRRDGEGVTRGGCRGRIAGVVSRREDGGGAGRRYEGGSKESTGKG